MSRDMELAHRARAVTPARSSRAGASPPGLCRSSCRVLCLPWGWAGAVSQLWQRSPCPRAVLPALGVQGGFLTRFWTVGGRTRLHLRSLRGQSSSPRNPGQVGHGTATGTIRSGHQGHRKWHWGDAKAWQGLEVQVMIWEELQQPPASAAPTFWVPKHLSALLTVTHTPHKSPRGGARAPKSGQMLPPSLPSERAAGKAGSWAQWEIPCSQGELSLGQNSPGNCQEAEPESPSHNCSDPVSPGHPGRGRAGEAQHKRLPQGTAGLHGLALPPATPAKALLALAQLVPGLSLRPELNSACAGRQHGAHCPRCVLAGGTRPSQPWCPRGATQGQARAEQTLVPSVPALLGLLFAAHPTGHRVHGTAGIFVSGGSGVAKDTSLLPALPWESHGAAECSVMSKAAIRSSARPLPSWFCNARVQRCRDLGGGAE